MLNFFAVYHQLQIHSCITTLKKIGTSGTFVPPHWKKWSQWNYFGKVVPQFKRGFILSLIIMFDGPLKRGGGDPVDMKMAPLWSHFCSTVFFKCSLNWLFGSCQKLCIESFWEFLNLAIQPAFLVIPCSKLEHVHWNTWKILTRKAVSFGVKENHFSMATQSCLQT